MEGHVKAVDTIDRIDKALSVVQLSQELENEVTVRVRVRVRVRFRVGMS